VKFVAGKKKNKNTGEYKIAEIETAYGTAPQFLKGHIDKESDTMDFGTPVDEGFAPSYRFEPYVTQEDFKIFNGEFSDNPFFITTSSTVDPPQHKNLTFPYFSGNAITVWQVVKDYSQLVEDYATKITRTYGTRTYADTMNYNAYPTIRKKYRSFFDKSKKFTIKDSDGKNRKLTFAERADTTNKLMIKYLRDEFQFYDEDGTKGMKNMIAQTRIASSYGYFQLLFTTAVLAPFNYPKNSSDYPPEKLNETNTVFPFAFKMYMKYFKSKDFIDGLEQKLYNQILDRWNEAKEYPAEAIQKMQKFLPKKN